MIQMKKRLKNNFFIFILLFIFGCTSVENRESENIDSKYLILKGMNLKKVGKYSQALELYKEALKSNGKDSILYQELGETYIKLGDYSKGIKYYKKALEISSYKMDINKNLAYAYYLEKDYSNSLDYINKLSERELDTESKKLKGYLLIKNKKLKEARDYLKSNENNIDVFDEVYYNSYLDFLEENNYNEDLQEVFNKIYEKYYNNLDAMTLYFRKKEKNCKDIVELEKELKRYIVNERTNDELYILLGEIEYKLKKYKESKMSLKFVSSEGKMSERYINLIRRLK
ncbi:tetratricopeptide repeat protein [Fusobacterium sp.]|uniref:tetratricopeptide repeat protein n=2 Tax=Fusobacterium sp. TaxID=68766 RepID=UPI00261CBE4D|nr:tetratricopeptide repeat protein [Fusobacterium sp.]